MEEKGNCFLFQEHIQYLAPGAWGTRTGALCKFTKAEKDLNLNTNNGVKINLAMNYSAPTYLTELVTAADQETLSIIHENYGDNTTAFKFKTKFGGIIQIWLEEWQQYGGTIWGIDTTGNKVLLFDQFTHGYNAMMKLNEEEDLNNTKSIDLTQPTEIIIAFQYSGDENEYLEDGTSKSGQDYFGWVVIYKKIDNKLDEVFSYECA